MMATREVRILLSALLVAGLTVAAGCGSGSSPEVAAGPEGTPDQELLAGRAAYADRCASCHGGNGSGTSIGPRLNRGRLLEAYPNLDDAASVVSGGRSRMPGFRGLLTEGEIDAVLRYIAEVL